MRLRNYTSRCIQLVILFAGIALWPSSARAAAPPLQPSSISVVSGNNQSAGKLQAFALPLTVIVKSSSGAGVSGKRVTFAAPSSGPACTFATSAITATVTTDSDGQASASCTATESEGSFQVSATVDGTAIATSFNLTVQPVTNPPPGGTSGPPAATVSFDRATLPLNTQTSAQLTIVISNPNADAITGVGFSSTLPAGLAANGVNAGSCTGAATASGSTVSLTGATMSANSSCTLNVAVKGTTPGAKAYSTGAVSGGGATGVSSNSATLTIVSPPVATVSFNPAGIAAGATTLLTITIANPNSGITLSSVGFTDVLPVGVFVASSAPPANCFGGAVSVLAGSGNLSLGNSAIPAGQSCTFSIPVTGTPGLKVHTLTVNSAEGGPTEAPPVTLTVVAPPALTLAFLPASVALNGISALTFNLTNPAVNAVAVNGIAFTDTLPAGLTVASPAAVSGTCGGGTITALAGASSISLSGASLAVNTSCSFSVSVMASIAGALATTVAATSSNSGSSAAASASLNTIAPPAISKTFGAPTIPLNGTTSLTINISNPAASNPIRSLKVESQPHAAPITPVNQALTGVGFTDNLPSGMTVATPNALANSCGGAVLAAAGAAGISLSGGSVSAGTTCAITVNVNGSSAGAKNNVTGNVTSNEGGTGNTASASVTVVAPPVLSLQFFPTSFAVNAISSLSFTITNPAANTVALTGVSLTDTLPAAIASTGFTGSCGGGVITATGQNISLTGATLAAGASCTFAVTVRGTASGNVSNTAIVSSGNGGTGNTASASLTVPASISINTNALPNGTQGVLYSQALGASGGAGGYDWSASGNLPAGISLSTSGLLSGTPTASGSFSFTVTVSDVSHATASQSLSLAIVPALKITTTALPGGSTNTVYSAGIDASGGTPPYTFSGTGLPPGLSLSPSGAIAGTPTKTGSYSLTVSVTDASGVTAQTNLSLPITAPGPLNVPGAALSAGTVAIPYSDVARAAGGTAPYTWSVAAGALPDGISINSAGTLQGTPSAAGTSSFTLQATDSAGGSASGSFSISVAAAPLKLSTGSLPAGIAGSDYPAQILMPSGGVAPFTFTLSAGNLPSGLTLSNGQISGIPTTAGSYSFSISVSDSQTPSQTVAGSFSILIKQAQADLILSSTSVPFSLITGAAGLPAPAGITVRSSVVLQLLNYSVAVNTSAPWLDVNAGGTSTPGSISVALSTQAMMLNAGSYSADIAVSCVSPSPCAGSTQHISVSLAVTAPAPKLSINAGLLSFSGSPGGAPPPSQPLGIQNSGGGSIGIASVTAADGWISVSGVPSTLPAGLAVPIGVSINPTGLAAGYYRSTITVVSSAGSASIPVGLLLAANATLSLSPAGTQFQAPAGNTPGNSSGSFAVSVSGGSSVNWSASVLPGASWLTLNSGSGVSTATSAGSVSFSLDTAAVSALAAGAYYGAIRVTSNDAVNSPQDFEVVLNISPAADPVKPDPQPAGLVFISNGVGSLPPQIVQVFASSKNDVSYQASTQVEAGAWLSVSPSTGTASSASPGQSSISADVKGLAPGVYRGGVSYAFSGSAVRTVNVTLIIQATGSLSAQSVSQVLQPRAAGCTATKLVPTQTGLAGNFSQPTAWPTPLSVKVVNDCGAAVSQALVLLTFSNGDPPLGLTAADPASGNYTGTWTPRTPAPQITIAARTTAPGYPAATTQITGQVMPNAAPLLTPNGTLHVFDPLVGGSLGPGNIVQIYGSGFATQTVAASSIPLPTKLAGASVIIGGIAAPLYFVSAGQINAQVPFELDPGKQYQILVNADGALTTPDNFQLTSVSPGIAAFPDGQIIAQHLDGGLVSATAPAKPGELIICYLAGLGLTDNPVLTGAGAPLDVLARPLVVPTLTLNGVSTPIQFVGLTPGLVGLYQANFTIPANTPDGDVRLVLSQGGLQSNVTLLPVRH